MPDKICPKCGKTVDGSSYSYPDKEGERVYFHIDCYEVDEEETEEDQGDIVLNILEAGRL